MPPTPRNTTENFTIRSAQTGKKHCPFTPVNPRSATLTPRKIPMPYFSAPNQLREVELSVSVKEHVLRAAPESYYTPWNGLASYPRARDSPLFPVRYARYDPDHLSELELVMEHFTQQVYTLFLMITAA